MHFFGKSLAVAFALSGTVVAKKAPANTWDKYADERGFDGYEDPREHNVAREAEPVADAAWQSSHGGPAPTYHAYGDIDGEAVPSIRYAARGVSTDVTAKSTPTSFAQVVKEKMGFNVAQDDDDNEEEDFSEVEGHDSEQFALDNGYDVLRTRDLDSQEDGENFPTDPSESFDFDAEEYSVGNNDDEDIYRRDAAPEASYGWATIQKLIRDKQHAHAPRDVVEEDTEALTKREAASVWSKLQHLIKDKHHVEVRDVNDEEAEIEAAWDKLQHFVENKHHVQPVARDLESDLAAAYAELEHMIKNKHHALPIKPRSVDEDEDTDSPEWAAEQGYAPLEDTTPVVTRSADALPPSAWKKLQNIIKDKHHAPRDVDTDSPEWAEEQGYLPLDDATLEARDAKAMPPPAWKKLQNIIKDKHHAPPHPIARDIDTDSPEWAEEQGYAPLDTTTPVDLQARNAEPEAAPFPPSAWKKLQNTIKDKHHAPRDVDTDSPEWAAEQGYVPLDADADVLASSTVEARDAEPVEAVGDVKKLVAVQGQREMPTTSVKSVPTESKEKKGGSWALW